MAEMQKVDSELSHISIEQYRYLVYILTIFPVTLVPLIW